MRQNIDLTAGEDIRWEARPAPRCYTFRHWRHSIFGTLILLVCGFWQYLGIEMSVEYELAWLVWLPTPFLLFAFYLAIGHLLQARLEWNHVYYAITDRRLITQRGLLKRRTDTMNLSEITYLTLHQQGDQLGTLRVYKGKEQQLVLHCIEHPGGAAQLRATLLFNWRRIHIPAQSLCGRRKSANRPGEVACRPHGKRDDTDAGENDLRRKVHKPA